MEYYDKVIFNMLDQCLFCYPDTKLLLCQQNQYYLTHCTPKCETGTINNNNNSTTRIGQDLTLTSWD